MKLFEKIKNSLYVEDDDALEIEEEKEEESSEDYEEVVSERELFKSETTFKFPVSFDEEEYEKEKKLYNTKNIFDLEKTSKLKEEKKEVKKEEKKYFRPTPIISPVYGILDKNYKKEEVKAKEKAIKQDNKDLYKTTDFDLVRKKAYGNLEDDIEDTLDLSGDNKGLFYNLNKEEEKEEESPLILEDLVEEDDVSLQDAIDNYMDFGLEYDGDSKSKEVGEVKIEESKDDLFDLIDSMYDKEEGD